MAQVAEEHKSKTSAELHTRIESTLFGFELIFALTLHFHIMAGWLECSVVLLCLFSRRYCRFNMQMWHDVDFLVCISNKSTSCECSILEQACPTHPNAVLMWSTQLTKALEKLNTENWQLNTEKQNSMSAGRPIDMLFVIP